MTFDFGDDFASTSNYYGDLAVVQVDCIAYDGCSKCLNAEAIAINNGVSRFVDVRVKFGSIQVQFVPSDGRRAISEW